MILLTEEQVKKISGEYYFITNGIRDTDPFVLKFHNVEFKQYVDNFLWIDRFITHLTTDLEESKIMAEDYLKSKKIQFDSPIAVHLKPNNSNSKALGNINDKITVKVKVKSIDYKSTPYGQAVEMFFINDNENVLKYFGKISEKSFDTQKLKDLITKNKNTEIQISGQIKGLQPYNKGILTVLGRIKWIQ